MTPSRRFATPVVVVALATALVGCDSSPTELPDVSLPGTWVLQSFNGKALPYHAVRGANELTIIADTLVLRDDGTWTSRGRYRVLEDGVERFEARPDSGRVTTTTGETRLSSQVHDESGGGRLLKLQGDRFMLSAVFRFAVYRKQ